MATVEKAASDRSMCKKCNQYIDKGTLRVGPSYSDWGNPWYHLSCVYPSFFNVSNSGQIGGYDSLPKSLQARVDSWLKKKKPEKKQSKKKQEDSDEDSGPDDGTQSRQIEQSSTDGKSLVVRFTYDSEIVEKLKSLVPAHQRSFTSGADPHWTINKEAAHCLKPLLNDYGFHAKDAVVKLINKKPTTTETKSNNNNSNATPFTKPSSPIFKEQGCIIDFLQKGGPVFIRFKYSKERVDFLKNVIPASFRTYQKEEQRWVIDRKGAYYLSYFEDQGIEIDPKVKELIAEAQKNGPPEESSSQNSNAVESTNASNNNNNNANTNNQGRTITLDASKEHFVLKFNYSKELVELVKKTFPQQDRQYNASTKDWSIDVTSTEGIEELISKHQFVAQPDVLEVLKKSGEPPKEDKEIGSELNSLPLKRKSEDDAKEENPKKQKEQ